jgi:hypothetical protein
VQGWGTSFNNSITLEFLQKRTKGPFGGISFFTDFSLEPFSVISALLLSSCVPCNWIHHIKPRSPPIVNDPRITRIGRLLRKTKLDELPQLVHVLFGQMSFVGPRPDVPGYADKLKGEDRVILSVRPGITGPATLKYRDEEALLAAQDDPERYNNEVLWPDKVRLNRQYVQNWSFWTDIRLILKTLTR